MELDQNHFRAVLLARRQELQTRVAEVGDQLDDPADADWDDRAIEMEDDEALEQLGNVSLRELRAVDAALTRIEAGSYGRCASCGEKIELQRLEAVPYATRCRNCMVDQPIP